MFKLPSSKSRPAKTALEIESEKISKILRDDLYKDVAKIIGLDENIKEKLALSKRKDYRRMYKGVRNISRALHIVTLDKESSEDYHSNTGYVEAPSPRRGTELSNPYYDFLQKSERDQVRWESKYLPPETEQEKGLVKRANDITDKICSEFCNYMDSLGGYDSPLFKHDVVKELFQIEFNTHAAKGVKIITKEINALPDGVAKFAKLPKISYEKTLTRQIRRDIIADSKLPNNLAFNQFLPKNKRWMPPKNDTKNNWMKRDHLPKQITTMENVWTGITNLKSVHGFCKWIIEHPNVDRPSYLKKQRMFEPQQLEKMYKRDQYDHENILPQIDISKEIDDQLERKASITTDELKILDI